MDLLRPDGAAMAGFYDLVRVNGDVLPVSVQVVTGLANDAPRYRIQAGELLLHPSGTFGLDSLPWRTRAANELRVGCSSPEVAGNSGPSGRRMPAGDW